MERDITCSRHNLKVQFILSSWNGWRNRGYKQMYWGISKMFYKRKPKEMVQLLTPCWVLAQHGVTLLHQNDPLRSFVRPPFPIVSLVPKRFHHCSGSRGYLATKTRNSYNFKTELRKNETTDANITQQETQWYYLSSKRSGLNSYSTISLNFHPTSQFTEAITMLFWSFYRTLPDRSCCLQFGSSTVLMDPPCSLCLTAASLSWR